MSIPLYLTLGVSLPAEREVSSASGASPGYCPILLSDLWSLPGALHYTIEKVTIPEEAYHILFEKYGSVCNLFGNYGCDLHIDESLETKGVLPTKTGAGNSTPESLERSFFTTGHLHDIHEHLIATSSIIPGMDEIDLNRIRDVEARSTNCVAAMPARLQKAPGSGSNTDRFRS